MNKLYAHFFKSPLMFAIPSKNDFSMEVVREHVSQKKGQKCCLLSFCTVYHFMLQAFQSHGLLKNFMKICNSA